MNKRAYSIKAFCEAYSVGRTHAFAEMKAGRLRAKKTGRRTIIPHEWAEEWLRSLPEEAHDSPPAQGPSA